MNCKTCRIEIEESESGEPRSRAAKAHLDSCADCTVFRKERLRLKSLIAGLEVVTTPPDFDFRLRARLAALRSESPTNGYWTRFVPSARALALAAAIVVLVLLGLVVRQSMLRPSSNTEQEKIVKKDEGNIETPSKRVDVPNPAGATSEIVTPSPVVSQNSTASQAKGTSRSNVGRVSTASSTSPGSNDEINSVDLGSTSPANSVLPPGIPDPMTLSSSNSAFSVRMTTQPTTIDLKDDVAGTRTISLRPVTFGGEDVVNPTTMKKVVGRSSQRTW
jgi:hypothetical protein